MALQASVVEQAANVHALFRSQVSVMKLSRMKAVAFVLYLYNHSSAIWTDLQNPAASFPEDGVHVSAEFLSVLCRDECLNCSGEAPAMNAAHSFSCEQMLCTARDTVSLMSSSENPDTVWRVSFAAYRRVAVVHPANPTAIAARAVAVNVQRTMFIVFCLSVWG